MRKISTLIILLMALGVIVRAQDFNNVIKELKDTCWRSGGNISNVNLQECYTYDRCFDIGDYVVVGKRDSHNVNQLIAVNMDESGKIEKRFLPNTYKELGFYSYQYDYNDGYLIGNAGGSPIGSGGSYKKPFIMEKDKEEEWIFKQILLPDNKVSRFYGQSIAIEGDYAVVGDCYDQTDYKGESKLKYAGAVYIFKRGKEKWELYQKITSKERVKGEKFGLTVDINKQIIIVGSGWGSVYEFKIDESEKWVQTQKLSKTNSDGAAYTGIIKIVNDEIVMLTDGTFKNSGGIYIFKNNNGEWVESQYIQPSDLGSIDCFGGVQEYQTRHISDKYIFVDANDEYMFIGCPQQDGKNYTGAIYVYKKKNDGTWFKVKKLTFEEPKYSGAYSGGFLLKNNLLFICFKDKNIEVSMRVIKFQE